LCGDFKPKLVFGIKPRFYINNKHENGTFAQVLGFKANGIIWIVKKAGGAERDTFL